MSQALSRKLVEVTADTLERLAFMFAFPAESAPAMDGERLETVRVEFNGPFCGGLELSLPAATLAELAVNMLGAEDGESLPTEQQHDALKELANVVCGNLLPVLAGDGAEFQLRPPGIVAAESLAAGAAEAVGYLLLEGGACRVRLRSDRLPALDAAGRTAGDGNL
jgi:hypothetical protein